MNRPHPLGQLSALQQMMMQLLEPLSDAECRHCYQPHLAPLLWLFGRAVYLETLLLRGLVQGEHQLTDPLRDIFSASQPTEVEWQRLPPKAHLLRWAHELQEENLLRLANGKRLPPHPLLAENRLIHLINQSRALLYEQMLQVLVERQLQRETPYRTRQPLLAGTPAADQVAIPQGHYRIGAKDEPGARDNELPPQVVQLSNFRIDRHPVSNSAYLAFMEAGGYARRELWSEAGWSRQQQDSAPHPHHWRRDAAGHWYGVGLNGPADLPPGEPVMGLSRDAAEAYANWTATLGDSLSGAVLQHEYQWEVAMRSQMLEQSGRVWEWCANPFHPFSEFKPDPEAAGGQAQFVEGHYSLRGGCLHSQPVVRRISFRHHGAAGSQLFSGTRLVYPPEES